MVKRKSLLILLQSKRKGGTLRISDTPLGVEVQRLHGRRSPSLAVSRLGSRIVSLSHSRRATRRGLLLSVGGAITADYWAACYSPRYFLVRSVDAYTVCALSSIVAVVFG